MKALPPCASAASTFGRYTTASGRLAAGAATGPAPLLFSTLCFTTIIVVLKGPWGTGVDSASTPPPSPPRASACKCRHRQAPGWLGGQAFELLGTRLYHLASLCLLMYIAFQLWRGSLPAGPAPMLLSRHGGSLGGAPVAPCATPPQRARARAQDCAALGWTPPGPRPDGCPPCPTCSCTEGEPCECPLECPSWQQAGQQAGQAAQRCPQPEQAPAGCDLHGKYDLAHLTQRQPQQVVGPVQVSTLGQRGSCG